LVLVWDSNIETCFGFPSAEIGAGVKSKNFRRKDQLEEFAEKIEMKPRQGTAGGRFPGKFCG
jgi:hypothetical protein